MTDGARSVAPAPAPSTRMAGTEPAVERPPLHAATWIVWAVAAVVSVQLAPNMLYVSLVLLVAVLVVEVHGRDTGLGARLPRLPRARRGFGLLRVVLTVATTHGIGTPMLTIPHVVLPSILGGFRVGGRSNGRCSGRRSPTRS